jgi:ribosomal protein S18 acetylase RimI-like enzyme
LNKIYVLLDYQRLGLGRRLVGHVARRFLSQGISSMSLFSQAENPSIRFFEAIGGEKLFSDAGEFHGGYGWRDLARLAAICPVE